MDSRRIERRSPLIWIAAIFLLARRAGFPLELPRPKKIENAALVGMIR